MNTRTTARMLFAILQKYDFSSKSQLGATFPNSNRSCLRYCKSTIFQANHNWQVDWCWSRPVVCDTAKVRFFKQITTYDGPFAQGYQLFAILQKYDFSSKSQHKDASSNSFFCCLRYCKSTIFQANHNDTTVQIIWLPVVCDTAKVRFFKQITTPKALIVLGILLFAILQKYDFSSKSQRQEILLTY